MSLFDKGLMVILGCSILFSLVAIPLILGRIPPNPVYGYRTRATLGDARIWYEANAYFGKRFLIANVLSAFMAVVLHQWQCLPPPIYLQVSIVLLAAPVAASWLLTARFIRSLKDDGPRKKEFQC